jgi:RNA polymerase sigma factor (sigma-70 family)
MSLEGSDMTRSIVEAEVESHEASVLYHYLEIPENVKALLDTLMVLIPRSGLIQGDRAAVQEMANELLGEVVKEVLTHSDRYDPSRSQPGTWLNQNALIILKRKRAEFHKRRMREPSFSYLQRNQEVSDENEFFDQFADPASVDPEQNVEANEQFESLLSRTSEGNRELLRLYIVDDFDSARLALKLGITAEAVRQRISRALKQLRTVLLKEQGGERNG